PFLLSLPLLGRHRMTWPRLIELSALFVAVAVVSLLALRSSTNILFIVLPFLGWAAWRFQLRGAAPAALITAGMASWAAAHGWGPFGSGSLFEKMLVLQGFNATVA